MGRYPGATIQSRFLRRVYAGIPRRYDIINHIMTWGLDRRWRRQAATECLVSSPERILDLGCGTGDFTIELARQAGGNSEIIGVDFSRSMLQIAEEKVKAVDKSSELAFISGDVADLPFPENYFDSVGTSFAFRNLTYNNPMFGQYIAEVLRVLRAGGRFVVLETSQPGTRFIKKLYHLYLRCFVFWLGYLVSGNREAYRYLVKSSINYYSPEELKKILVEAGFRQVCFRRLLFGAVSIHTAIK